jgi:hypothetical protein
MMNLKLEVSKHSYSQFFPGKKNEESVLFTQLKHRLLLFQDDESAVCSVHHTCIKVLL